MTPEVKYLLGDTRDMVATIPDGSVSLVACSPPFIALRSYLPADHPLKHAEIGSEPDPATFLDTLLELTAEWGRVLAPWGSIAVELGDTYSSSGTQESGWHRSGAEDVDRYRSLGAAFDAKRNGGTNWPRPKCLALVPQLYAASLAYGRNLLTGQPSPAGQWLVRNVVVWHRPNPAVGALGDKYRPSTSYITIATRSPKRWFDLTAVRTAYAESTIRSDGGTRATDKFATRTSGIGFTPKTNAMTHAGAPPLDAWFDHHDTWTLTTQPSSLAHYAMWPAKLAERLVLSMCPAEVCSVCGEPRRRVERTTNAVGKAVRSRADGRHGRDDCLVSTASPDRADRETLGWTDCGCGRHKCTTCGHESHAVAARLDGFVCTSCGGNLERQTPWTPGTVLDPFAGTGTTLAVAHLHGRNAIGIDIDERNRDMYPARLEECRRTLFGTKPEMEGQMSLLGDG
jgi:hypothetical protein